LNKVNLSSSRRLKVKALSGGMKRRLGIAQALLHDHAKSIYFYAEK
jgi:ABC-2 type transport system ATP-binding protein